MSLNLIFTTTHETLTSLITLRLRQREPNPYYFIWHVCVCLWVSSYVSHISGAVIDRRVECAYCSRKVLIRENSDGLRSSLQSVPASETVTPNHSLWCVYCGGGFMRLIHTASLMQRVYIGDATEQLVEQLMKQPWHSVSVIYTTLRPITLTLWGGYVGMLVCLSVCIFQLVTNAGEIQMSQNDQCPVERLGGDNLQPRH